MSTQISKTYQPVQSISINANEDLPGFRFVSHLGTLCSDETRAVGVTETDWVNGELAAVVTLGTIAIETTTTINIGDDVTSAITGKAKTASGTMPVNGRALDSCEGAGFVRIKLVP
ncbi:MAG: hypothetical protein HW421_3785 [Ignavibacteria bacterium]|nr:hypothetical protein [Ignavibacteria bacterium]